MIIPFLGWKIPGKHILHLALLQPRDSFAGYERKLINGFFIAGDTTDTMTIRAYYRKKNKSFLPVNKIKEPLEKRVAQLTKAIKDPLKYRWLYIAAGLAVAFLLMLTNGFVHKEELPLTISSGFFGIVAMIVGGNLTWGQFQFFIK